MKIRIAPTLKPQPLSQPVKVFIKVKVAKQSTYDKLKPTGCAGPFQYMQKIYPSKHLCSMVAQLPEGWSLVSWWEVKNEALHGKFFMNPNWEVFVEEATCL